MTRNAALIELLRALKTYDYRFIAVTPATHARVLARPHERPGLRDILGWNRPFRPHEIPSDIAQLLEAAQALDRLDSGMLRSRIRVASLDDDLFIHSSFPTEASDSVFFGPDTYRFVRFIQRQLLHTGGVKHVVDMGAGTGAGGIVVRRRYAGAKITCVDVNNRAVEYARANAAAAGVDVDLVQSDRVPNGADLMIANPPYMMDARSRSYRDGGQLLGGTVALDWVRQALSTMAAGGKVLLYTGAAYVNGGSPLLAALEEECESAGAALVAEELDPDVFGEELDEPAYQRVERIAAVGITISIKADSRFGTSPRSI